MVELLSFSIACLSVFCLSSLILVFRCGISFVVLSTKLLNWLQYEFGSKLCGAFADCRGILAGIDRKSVV